MAIAGAILVVYAPHSWLCPVASPTNTVNLVAMSSQSSKMVVVRNGGRDVEIWDANGDHPDQQFAVVGYTGGISSIALSPDEKIALTGSYDGSATLWDTQ